MAEIREINFREKMTLDQLNKGDTFKTIDPIDGDRDVIYIKTERLHEAFTNCWASRRCEIVAIPNKTIVTPYEIIQITVRPR